MKRASWLAAILPLLATPAALAQDAPAPVSILPQNLTPPPVQAPEEPKIAVGELAAPAADRVGLLDVSKGGFPLEVWADTDAEVLRLLLQHLPTTISSPAQRRLAENLMLSPAAPPSASRPMSADDSAAEPAPEPSTSWLIESRLKTLAGLGEWTDALALLDLLPPADMTESLRRLRADGFLVTGRLNNACGEAQTALKTSSDAYWQRIQVFCQLSADQASAATLGLGVLREQQVDDPGFFWLSDLMLGNRPIVPKNLTVLTPLHIAMLRKAGGALPDSLLTVTDPTTVGAIAALPLAPPDPADKSPAAAKRERQRLALEARMLMAERALALGALGPDELRALYRRWDSKLDPNPPSLTKATAGDVRARALLFQSAIIQTVPTARAEVMARAIDLARTDRGQTGPDLTIVGKVYAGLISELEPSAELAWFAGDAARALLAAGASEKAKVWLDMARNMARTSGEAALVADGLWPLERLMEPGQKDRFQARAFQAWIATVPAEAVPRRRETLLGLLAAVGEPVSPIQWRPALNELPAPTEVLLPPPAIWNGLEIAARTGHAGAAAVYGLLALGAAGPGHASAAVAQKVIATLMAAGREQDARAMALETALIQGL